MFGAYVTVGCAYVIRRRPLALQCGYLISDEYSHPNVPLVPVRCMYIRRSRQYFLSTTPRRIPHPLRLSLFSSITPGYITHVTSSGGRVLRFPHHLSSSLFCILGRVRVHDSHASAGGSLHFAFRPCRLCIARLRRLQVSHLQARLPRTDFRTAQFQSQSHLFPPPSPVASLRVGFFPMVFLLPCVVVGVFLLYFSCTIHVGPNRVL
jgi:hypothetical protein